MLTTFGYADLEINTAPITAATGNDDAVVKVSATVTNTGNRERRRGYTGSLGAIPAVHRGTRPQGREPASYRITRSTNLCAQG